ncbi:MAG: hypothetical protein LBK62_12265, partial [Treponema sp.]|nr:hypothetical protein [Treponema sp.]
MATISKKISETDYERIGDTQGLMIPAPLKSTVFKPVVPGTMAAGTNYILTPEQIVLNDLGIDSDGFIPVKTGDCLIIEYPQMQFTASGTPSGSWFIDCFLADKTTVWETLSPWAPTYNNNLTPSSTYVRI